jgi:group II intron reverse transcriptase/maturase
MFEEAYQKLNKTAAFGIDRVTWKEYGCNLQENLIELENKLKQKRYWPQFIKRIEIPKPNGKTRPLGISVLEDKIVQQVTTDILNALYEPLFLPCSYAYRPEKSAKQAVIDLRDEIENKYTWVVEADIKGFFDHLDHDWLLKMIQTRVNDKAFTELIRRFLKAGVVVTGGTIEYPEQGSPQGSIMSPVLANIYLHYVLDLWFKKEVKSHCKGASFMVRYADDFAAAFRFHTEAKAFLKALEARFKKFNLEIAKEKTRKLMFSRFNKERSEAFVFLGYEFRWKTTRKGRDIVSTMMYRKKMKRIIAEFSDWCKDNRNKRIAKIMGAVKSKLRGICNYFDLPGNTIRHREITYIFRRKLYYWLNKRSERRSYNWKTFGYIWKGFFGIKREILINQGVQISFVNKLM